MSPIEINVAEATASLFPSDCSCLIVSTQLIFINIESADFSNLATPARVDSDPHFSENPSMYAHLHVPGTDCTVGRVIPYAGDQGAPTTHAGAAAQADSHLEASTAANAARDAAHHQRHLESTQRALEQCFAVAGLSLPNSARIGNPPVGISAPASIVGMSNTHPVGQEHLSGWSVAMACAIAAAVMLATFGIGGYLSYLAMQ